MSATVTAPVITGTPIALPGSASEQGEPTIEELAALLPEPLPTTIDESAAEAKAALEPGEVAEAEVTAAEEPAVVDPVAPTEADAAAERALAAAKVARAGSRRYAAQQEALRTQAAQVQQAAREAETLRQRVAQADALDRELKADPYKALKGRGVTDVDLAARAMRENTPEAVTQRLQEQLDAERTARLALETRLENEQKAARQARVVAQAETDFTAIADDDAKYPELSQLTAEGQLANARLALARIERNGHTTGDLTTAQIAEAAERYIKMTRKAKAAAAAVVPAVAKAKPSGVTLTNRQAQTRAVAPAEWDSLTEDQQIAHLAATLPST